MTVRNGIDEAFHVARREGRSVLIVYLTGGFPDPDVFVELALAVLEAGADVLEIGIPFSDPLLDGPVIQHSQGVALDRGVTPVDCLHFAQQIRARVDKPLVFMGAYNPIFRYGPREFSRDAASAGVAGLVVPDLPLEESAELRAAADEHGLHLIQLVAPTSSEDRIGRICATASGFIYCVSVAGVTGARADVVETARPLVDRARACTSLPVAVGFGIGEPRVARQVAGFADGVIVGSALIDAIAHAMPDEREQVAAGFVAGLQAALQPSGSPR